MFTCRSVNEAVPTGKETSIELDVHRERGAPRGPRDPAGAACSPAHDPGCDLVSLSLSFQFCKPEEA